jgi:hypothetical protein
MRMLICRRQQETRALLQPFFELQVGSLLRYSTTKKQLIHCQYYIQRDFNKKTADKRYMLPRDFNKKTADKRYMLPRDFNKKTADKRYMFARHLTKK